MPVHVANLNTGESQKETTRSPHGPLTIPCENCHTAAGWRPIRAVPEFDHNKTRYPLRGMHEKVQCVECHVKPVFTDVGKNCADCHADIHRRQMGPNCEQCHTVSGWNIAVQQVKDHQNRFPLLGAHAAVQCDECHKQLASGIFYGLSTECNSCHLKDWQKTTNPPHASAGPAFASGNCQGCHNFDSWLGAKFDHSTTGFLLTNGHANLACTACHISNNYNLQVAPTACGTSGCHLSTWQQTNNPPHPSSGPSFAAANCYNCHTSTVSWTLVTFNHASTGFPLTNGHANVACTACHVNNNYTLTIAPTDCGNSGCHLTTWQQTNNPVHSTAGPSFAVGNCSACHDTIAWTNATAFNHASTGFALTGIHATTPCLQCHVNNNYSLTSADCMGCHLTSWTSTQTIGGNVPNHVASNFPTGASACSTCHPITTWADGKFDHTTTGFPLTNSHQMSPAGKVSACTQCHVGGNYSLTIQPTDCGNAGCHLTAWQTTNNPVHSTAGPSFAVGNCSACHDTIAWTDANNSFNHATTGFALTGTHATTPCAQCHVNNNYALNSADCMGCHLSSWNSTQTLGGSVPNHVTANFPTTAAACSSCHPITTWAAGVFDHTSTGFPLTNSHQMAPAGKVTACTQCHVGGNFSLTTAPTDCGNAGCHLTTWQTTNNPTHSTAGAAFAAANCATCHDTIAWTDNSFNHAVTGFALTGMHISPTPTPCVSCHVGNNYNLTSADCYGCHTKDWNSTQTLGGVVPNHVSAGFPTTLCSQCHNTTSWATSTFNHSTTGFALTGTHATTTCASCHVSNNYSLTSANTDCMSCHLSSWTSTQTLGGNVPNHVAANFPATAAACSSCHPITTWAAGTFDHSTTGFPLTNSHQMSPAGKVTACTQCHVGGNYALTIQPTDCGNSGCHLTTWQQTNNPTHSTAGTAFAAANCSTCHDTIAWTDNSFNHSVTGFALTGTHTSPTPTPCVSCHVNNNYNLTSADCMGCHLSSWTSTQTLGGNVPNHVAANFPQTASACSGCHPITTWAAGMFDHATTGWALTGGHQMVPAAGGIITACTQCHVGGNYALTTANTVCYGCHLAEWTSTQTLGGAVPNHVSAGYPTTCESCHTTTSWLGATFNHTWFPIPHHSSVCNDCHQVSTDYTSFTCINCHTNNYHTQTRTDGQHGGVGGYTYGPETCYTCHKNGGGG